MDFTFSSTRRIYKFDNSSYFIRKLLGEGGGDDIVDSTFSREEDERSLGTKNEVKRSRKRNEGRESPRCEDDGKKEEATQQRTDGGETVSRSFPLSLSFCPPP